MVGWDREDLTDLLEDIDVSLGGGVVQVGLEDMLLLAECKLKLTDDL